MIQANRVPHPCIIQVYQLKKSEFQQFSSEKFALLTVRVMCARTLLFYSSCDDDRQLCRVEHARSSLQPLAPLN
jgi:hypothetical protein